MKLVFHDKRFRVLIIADTQEGICVNSDTINLMNAILDKAKPDLVVFSGDQIWGKNTFKGNIAEVKRVLSELLKPVIDRKIPFSICFGNHDSEVGVSKEEQFKIYSTFDGFVGESVLGIDGVGNQCIEIYENNIQKYLIYLFDSHENVKNGYDNVHKNQLEWYKKVRDEKVATVGDFIPSIVIQHIPICEVFNILVEVDANTPGCVKGFGRYEGKNFILNKRLVKDTDFMLELPCASYDNSGEFEVLKEKGDIKGLFFAHDHNNCYQSNLDGILIANTQGIGFNAYGPGLNRGARVIDLFTDGTLESFDLRYVDLIGHRVSNPLKYFFTKFLPINEYDAKEKTYRLIKFSIICILIAIIALLIII